MILAEGPDTVAAFIGEPILGTGGIVPPPKGYWAKIQAVLKKYDILLVADEVVTGFGRLGTHVRLRPLRHEAGPDHHRQGPDLGLCAAVGRHRRRIACGRCWCKVPTSSASIGHGWTYSAHPICAAAGVANLKLIDELGLVDNAAETGAYFRKGLSEALADHAHVGDVRGDGSDGGRRVRRGPR